MIHPRKTWFDRNAITKTHSGRLIPYACFILSSIGIALTPITTDRQVCYQGKSVGCVQWPNKPLSLYIDVDATNVAKSEHEVCIDVYGDYAQIIKPLLADSCNVKVWTFKGDDNLTQIEIDGQMIIPYSWWENTKMLWLLFAIGAITFYPIERAYQNVKRGFKADRVLNEYNLDITAKFPSKNKAYKYYVARNTSYRTIPMCVKLYCIPLFGAKPSTLLELIYYIVELKQIDHQSRRIVRKYCFQVNNEFASFDSLPVVTTDFELSDIALKQELGGRWQRFLAKYKPCYHHELSTILPD